MTGPDLAGLERKFCAPTAALDLGADARIRGYASLFGRIDRGGDRIAPGAYGASLARLAQEGRQVRMLWQHDPGRPIGVWDRLAEDTQGLAVDGRLLTGVAQGAEAFALLQAGAIDGLSIGYRTVRAERHPDGTRLLQEIDLWEVSLVTFPMQPEARVAPAGGAAEAAELAAALAKARRWLGASIESEDEAHDG
ncbi:HK97 family phage prohead protease [Oceanomicrobium pacificus]|uniref:HK97 family phage prohead protease n=1 Tax=Oceanomicrobium pacificus TaxID=2692916 RepID=A0A6B0TZ65_9RHOB|nr:HK97 family phage prohead protease [Oceanomicrobium pacificus]MXU66313.1 HK97 family phage prohead protease [Oceanomicrobium pacificus]